jgi:hypothetical protein
MVRTTWVLLCAGLLAPGCSSNSGSDESGWSSSVTKLVLASTGGFGSSSQPTPECPHDGSEYTLLVANRTLSAWRCAPGHDAPYPLTKASVSRTLTQPEFDALRPTLEALKVVHVDTCGADKPVVVVTLTTPSGTTEYADSFYSCNHDDPRPTLDTVALDDAAQALRQLSFGS